MKTTLVLFLSLVSAGEQDLTVNELKIIGNEWFSEVAEDAPDSEYQLLLREIKMYAGTTPNHIRWYCHNHRSAVLAEHRAMKDLAGFSLYRVGCLRSVWQHALGQETFMSFSMRHSKEGRNAYLPCSPDLWL